jgi:hypothetical protein
MWAVFVHDALAVGPDGTVWAPGVGELVTCGESCTPVTDGLPNCSDLAMGLETDGTVWTSGAAWWGPSRSLPGSDVRQLEGCLQRFDGTSWSRVSPPFAPWATARLLVAAPSGGVWAWLADPRVRPANIEFRLLGRTLARFANGAWATIPGTPHGDITSMVDTGTALWVVVSASDSACDPAAPTSSSRLYRFDGTDWALVRSGVGKVHATRPDGSVWVTNCDGALTSS